MESRPLRTTEEWKHRDGIPMLDSQAYLRRARLVAPGKLARPRRRAGWMSQLYASWEGDVNTAEPYICTRVSSIGRRPLDNTRIYVQNVYRYGEEGWTA
jgi:hypothetical protein